MGGPVDLDRPFKIEGGGKPVHMSQIGSLYQELRHLLLPMNTYHYSETNITNLLLFTKLANKYYIICNTKIDDAINVQNDGKYLQFQRDNKFNLYYMDISEADLDEHYYLNTVKKRKTTFSILDQKRAKSVRILQERCGFPSDEDFVNALEYNSINGADFGRRNVIIANEIYDYSKGNVMGRFKHQAKGVKRDRTTEDITAPVPP